MDGNEEVLLTLDLLNRMVSFNEVNYSLSFFLKKRLYYITVTCEVFFLLIGCAKIYRWNLVTLF